MGDYIGGGQEYLYTVPPDEISAQSDGHTFTASITGYNGDWWYVDMQAPDGQQLVPGTYTDATRYPFNGAGPGLSIFGNGRGCNQSIGTFTVLDAVYGPSGYVQTFDATFEQHCEGATQALRGEIRIDNPPPPPALAVTFKIASKGTVSRVTGNATITGTVTCNEAVNVNLDGSLTQRASRTLLVSGSGSQQVSCSTTPTTWTMTIAPNSSAPFNPAKAAATITASGYDPNYGVGVSSTAQATVRLTR